MADNFNIALDKINENKNLSLEESSDIELIKKLMEIDPWYFSLGSIDLRGQLDFAKKALTCHIGNVQFVNERLFDNVLFMSYLVSNFEPYFTDYGVFEYSWEYSGKVISENPFNFQVIPGPNIWSSSDFLSLVIPKFPWAMDFVPLQLKSNFDFISPIAKLNSESFIYLPEEVVSRLK